MPNALPPLIADYLRRVVVRARRREMISAWLRASAVFGAWGLSACAIDRFSHLSSGERIGALAGGVAVAMGVLLWPHRIGTKRRRIDWVAVAEAVERDRPGFGQRLVTIVSRLLGPAEHRGSEAMIAELRQEVEERITDDRSPALAQRRRRGGLAGPMLACAAVIAAAAGMLRVPGLELPRLAERFVLPWRAAAPVTTTRLIVQPGRNSDLADSSELRVDVVAEHLGDGVVSLFTQSADGPGGQARWSRLTMDQLSPGRFEYLFAGLDRDLRYYVAGGDATSPVYTVRLLRKPAVSAIRIHYRYPAFVRRGDATVVNADGQIEAPVGTSADIAVTATEPLQSATLRLGGQSIAMSPTSDPATFLATIHVEHDASGMLDLTSARQIHAESRLRIRALPIRPPILRLTDASGEPGAVLNTDPRQMLPVAFEAEDDFGLRGLVLRWRINRGERGKSGETPVAIPDGVRHIQDAVDFDLATLPLRLGDVLTVWLEVRNTAGQTTVSQPIEALMAIKPVDAQMRLRLAALDAAAGFADRLAGHVAAAVGGGSGNAGGTPGGNPAAAPRRGADGGDESLSAQLSSATEDAGLLRQALLRAIAQGAPPKAGLALEYWVDSATVQSYWADRLFKQLGDGGELGPAGRAKLTELAASAKAMRDGLLIVDQGWWASASLAEWENAKSSNRPGGVIARVRQDATDDARAAGCAEGADLPVRLAAKVAQADAALAALGPVDFVPAAREWSAQVARDPQTRPGLAQRLRSAAEAEALRQQGDLPGARDLELASQAADALQTVAAEQPGHAALSEFAPALSALQREHRMDSGFPTAAPSEQALIRTSADAARQQMRQWAGLADGSAKPIASAARGGDAPASPGAAVRVAESAAIAAAADAATHSAPATRPARAIAVARPAAARMRSAVSVSQRLARARQIDAIDRRQQDLLKQTSNAQPTEAPALAQRQQQVADSIATVAAGSEPAAIGRDGDSGANARQREAQTLTKIGQQLAEMPQQLAAARDAMTDAISASAHADAARAQWMQASAKPTQSDSAELIRAAQRAAEQSSADAEDASRRLAAAMQPVSAATAREMGRRLEPYASEASAAGTAIDDQLAPALAEFQKSVAARDGAAADRAGGPARDAIAAALQALADAQDALSARDPLVTASSSARAAVASLRHSPPDFSTAVRHQTQVTLALSRAWDQSIHGAAAERLAAVPGLAPLFANAAGAGPAGPGAEDGGVPLAAQVAPMLAQPWGRLPAQAGDAPTVVGEGDNADPPGFEDALRLYFQALGRAQKEGK